MWKSSRVLVVIAATALHIQMAGAAPQATAGVTGTLVPRPPSDDEQRQTIPPPPPRPGEYVTDRAPSENLSYRTRNPPVYPADAVKAKHEGTVVLMVLVGTDGAVKHVDVEHSSGYPELDAAAIEPTARWHFNPGYKNGEPQESYARIPVAFELPRTQL